MDGTAVQWPPVGKETNGVYRPKISHAAPGIGQHVENGTTLCIIEAMKLMNEIESDAAGKIVKILVENGQPVEYGQPLFLLEA